MSTLTAQLVVSMINEVTAPARAAARSIGNLRDAARRNAQEMAAMRGKMFDAVAMGYALARAMSSPMRAARDFETMLEDIGQKADIPQTALAAIGKEIRDIGVATRQGATEIGKSVDYFLGMGASREVSMAVATPIGMAATAYRAATEDLAKATFASIDNLSVQARQASLALDIMSAAGKEGGFELKDMAKEFPAITAAAKALGIEGVGGVADLVAALEVARKGTATGAEAANNMANFMQKIVSKEAIKSFSKFGVDVPREIKRAVENGVSPIEHMLGIIDRITKGGQADLVARLFGDKQVVEFLRPLLANMEEYRRIREVAMKSAGTVQADFDRRMKTTEGALMHFRAIMENVRISIGSSLLPGMVAMLETIIPILSRLADLADAYPQVTAAVVGLASSLIGLRVASFAARYAYLFMKGGVIEGALAVAKASEKIASAGRRLKVAAIGLSMLNTVGGGLAPLAGMLGSIAWPALAAAAGIAALGLLVHKYWEPISNFVSGLASGIGDAVGLALDALVGFGADAASAVGGWAKNKLIDVAQWFGLDQATAQAAVDVALEWVRASAQRIIDFVKGIPSQIGDWMSGIFSMTDYSDAQEAEFRARGERMVWALLGEIRLAAGSLYEVGASLMSSLWEGMKSVFSGIVGWASSIGQKIRSAVGGAASAAPTASSAGMVSIGASAPARAAGGPIVGGRTYLVGEEGRELITPSRDGYVHDAAATRRMLSGRAASLAAGPRVSFGDIIIQGVQDPEAIAARIGQAIEERIAGLQADLEWAHS